MLDADRDSATAERVARNEATFREANERIRAVAARTDVGESDLLPFLCECADMRCTEVVRLKAPEYEAVRREPTHFVSAHGHVASAEGWGRVVEELERYAVVEKLGEAAEIVADLDPRTGAAG